jgi:8-oxo-dGTP pyrophosphatase MutT (NUDIX family)
MPIKSVGIINIKDDEVLMVRRKHSFGYMDFVRGNYPIYSLSQVTNYVREMTVAEHDNLLHMTFSELWKDIWGKEPTGSVNQRIAEDKYTKLKNGLHGKTLEEIVRECDTAWSEPEWGFPKGRCNPRETDLAGALREYEEETGYKATTLNIITNVVPYEEIFIGSNYKAYKHVYYVAKSSNTSPLKSYQQNEIGDMKFFTFEAAAKAVRPYNTERLHIISKLKALCAYHTF